LKAPQKVEYNKTVLAGLNFLLSKQGKDGAFAVSMYAHALATLAVCEALALSRDPKLAQPAQRSDSAVTANLEQSPTQDMQAFHATVTRHRSSAGTG
jgi:hypothetical protein